MNDRIQSYRFWVVPDDHPLRLRFTDCDGMGFYDATRIRVRPHSGLPRHHSVDHEFWAVRDQSGGFLDGNGDVFYRSDTRRAVPRSCRFTRDAALTVAETAARRALTEFEAFHEATSSG